MLIEPAPKSLLMLVLTRRYGIRLTPMLKHQLRKRLPMAAFLRNRRQTNRLKPNLIALHQHFGVEGSVGAGTAMDGEGSDTCEQRHPIERRRQCRKIYSLATARGCRRTG